MKICIQDVTESGLELIFSGEERVLSEALETVQVPEWVRIDPAITGRLQVQKSGDEIVLVAQVSAEMSLQCARCLEWVPSSKEIDVHLLVRSGLPSLPPEYEMEPSDADEMVAEGSELDIGRIIVQELLLELPMKPLCKEDCPGFCPVCGGRKGEGECRCGSEEPADTRWAALEKLKEKLTK
jgi:uncharacterized protein